jgi:hypothetical protein
MTAITVGAPGTDDIGVTASVAADDGEAPIRLTATTVKV